MPNSGGSNEKSNVESNENSNGGSNEKSNSAANEKSNSASNEKSNNASNEKSNRGSHEIEEPKKLKYPLSVFFIIGNEFCERFTYYGLRTVLTIYLSQRLYYSEDTATIIYHCFALIAYFTPVLGAIIADSWLGKFWTILFLSILYCIGGIILSFGAFPNELSTMKIISLAGLFIIALGTGGIKPCVAAFGGDQFKEGQERELQRFFSLFYLAINLGSLVSTFLTPILREDVHCLGEKSCYPVAFGVPAMLMIVALLFFLCGKTLYVIRPPEGNIVLKVTKCICYAVGKKIKSTEKKKSHWLDYADDKFDKNLISDIKILFHVLVLYIPLPLFWALFDQQGSRWTLQATRMDGEVGSYHIKADQMQVLNPFLIVAFIPLFEYCVYPLLAKCRLLTKPLQKITTGGVLAAISFVIAGLIELDLETAYPVMPNHGESQLTIINNSPCTITINGTNLYTLKPFNTTVVHELQLYQLSSWQFTPENCELSNTPLDFTFNSTTDIESMMISIFNGSVVVQKINDTKTKSENGEPIIRMFYNIDPPQGNISFKFTGEKGTYYIDADSQKPYGITTYCHFTPGMYKMHMPYNSTDYQATSFATKRFHSGGIYILSIYSKRGETQQVFTEYEMVKGNYLTILLQIPQYVIITAGEIMFSITGLEFSYSQAPTSMKSVVQSAWLLTVAFGNLIVLVIAKAKLFERQSHELFLFATLMGVDMIIFAILAYFYKYVTVKRPSADEMETTQPKGTSNEAYEEETDFNK